MKKITKLLILIVLFSNLACSSFNSKKNAKEFIMKNLMTFYIESQDSVNFYFVMNSVLPLELSKSVPKMEYLKVYFMGQNEDSAVYPQEIINSSYKRANQQINLTYAYMKKFKKDELPKDWKQSKINIALNSNYGKYTIVKSIDDINYSDIFPEIQALYLLPTIKINNGVYNFQLLAIRLNTVQGSYLPTSEKLRLEIQNEKILYNSSEGKNFMQMISNVLPEEIGNYYVYQQSINFTNEKTKFKGECKAKLIIPAVPINYVSMIDFWSD